MPIIVSRLEIQLSKGLLSPTEHVLLKNDFE